MVDSRFKELDFDQDELVIEAFEFFEQAVDECEGIIIRLLGHIEGDETGFKVLSKEAPAF